MGIRRSSILIVVVLLMVWLRVVVVFVGVASEVIVVTME